MNEDRLASMQASESLYVSAGSEDAQSDSPGMIVESVLFF
jgi:hypothetical protein